MDSDDFVSNEGRAVARLARRFIDEYGTSVLDEALKVIRMLHELDRTELSHLWVRVALIISVLAPGSSRPRGSIH